MENAMQRVTILGATGSIGVSTLDVLARHPDQYGVYALSSAANSVRPAPSSARPRPPRACAS
jgi:1-deoxy-D-xylulose-5-phosphate reductoisomerase